MAPSILHRALSFSNVPVHRHDVPPLKEASAASNRHEGLALLTAIAEDTGFCNPSPLPNHLALEKSLISKILVLREALDLPCRSSCDALDPLLLDTLEALKITYPKCLSGLSGNHTSSEQQGLVHLRKVLMSVQERSQLSNLGVEKQTIIESESLDRVGGHVAMIFDQVIPVAKEIFSFMESSTSAKAAAAAAVRPEKRSLPPALCRTRSLVHRRSAGHHPSDSAEVATPCPDGAMRHAKQLKFQKPVPRQEADEGGCTGEGGQTSRRDPPSTPTGDSVLLQSTPSSMSPHPLSAPPPSPMPLLGMPMLLQSLEAMQQDDNASPAVVSPPDAQPAKVAAPTAQQDTVDVDDSAISVSMEAGQPSSPSSMDGNAAVPSVLPPPPPPLPANGDRVQGGPSTDKPAEVVASASSPPQGGPPANVSRAPPPPPPGNISAALRAKKAGKLKRSTQMGTLYRHLRDRVEGPCAHGGKRQTGNKPRTPGGSKSEAGQGMADALAEMTKRSAYFRQIEEDAENHAAAILELKDAIGSFESRDMAELVRFHQHVEQQLVCLTDETQVLARFEGFPSKKLESLRMAAALYSKLDGTVSKLKGWKLAAPLSNQLDRVEGYFNKIKDDVDMIERNKDEEAKRFLSHNIHFDFAVLVRIKECMVDLSSNCLELALKESKHARETSAVQSPGASPQAAAPSKMLWRVFQLAFRVYNFAGGQDERADRLTATLAHEIEAHPL
ncbi:hypothetical protein PAHAL_1G437200 [Panicum hallii]|uniref:Hydroxyproline-rich glycoprotein family protein n=1 Tax=Panicum hallii TaxID=206008 RepID=A0A2S3GUQ1_9POAL|nr:hypothetical protein PAHAL_1G437200 [Panicum hallii]